MAAEKIKIFAGIKNLLIGLGVTLRHLFSKSITLQYPTERWKMPERSRGIVVLLSDEDTGELNCTACTLCAKACPTAAIVIERHKSEETKKWVLDKFDLDNTICCYCGLCEEACSFDALKLSTKYEFSVYDKEVLHYDKDRLQEVGMDVKYVRKRPKKKPAPPKPKVDAEAKAETKEEVKPEIKTDDDKTTNSSEESK